MATPVPFAQRTIPATSNAGSLSTVQVVTVHGQTAVADAYKKAVVTHKEGVVDIDVDVITKYGVVHIPIPSPPTMTSALKPISLSLQVSGSTATVDDVYLLCGEDVLFSATGLAQSASFSLPIPPGGAYAIESGLCLMLGIKGHDTGGFTGGIISLLCAAVVFST